MKARVADPHAWGFIPPRPARGLEGGHELLYGVPVGLTTYACEVASQCAVALHGWAGGRRRGRHGTWHAYSKECAYRGTRLGGNTANTCHHRNATYTKRSSVTVGCLFASLRQVHTGTHPRLNPCLLFISLHAWCYMVHGKA